MELLPRRRAWYWARVGALGIAVASTFVILLVVVAVGAFFLSGGFNDDEWDSDSLPNAKRLELTNWTLATYPFLHHVQGERNIRIKGVTPWTFTGSFGHYFLSYSVEPERVLELVAAWRDRDDATEENVGPIDRAYNNPPAWWPGDARPNVVGIARLNAHDRRVHSVSVWCNESTGTFYVFFSWGH